MRVIQRTVNVLRLGQLGFYAKVLLIASVSLFAMVTIRPRNELYSETGFHEDFPDGVAPDQQSEDHDRYKFLPVSGEDSKPRSYGGSGNSFNLTASTMGPTTPQLINRVAKSPSHNDPSMALTETDVISVLESSMKILCICQTTGSRHKERAAMVKETWGRRCTKLVFASDVDDEDLPSYRFAEFPGRQYVTFKMRGALQWAHDNELNNFDWFMKADDDSFIVMENLQAFLSRYSPNDDHYFGRHFSVKGSIVGESFVSGAAYVLSRTTLGKLVEQSYTNSTICPLPATDEHEDVNLGYCLRNIGIFPGETRDERGRHRFLVFSPWVHLLPGTADANHWIRTYDHSPYMEGEECCSDTAILLHYVPGGYMLAMEYLLYRLRPLGANTIDQSRMKSLLPSGINNIDELTKLLKSLGYNSENNSRVEVAPISQPYQSTASNSNNKIPQPNDKIANEMLEAQGLSSQLHHLQTKL